jgi:hypothetical protein
MFLEDHERMVLREQGTNTTTSTYLKSGLHPLNPHCENLEHGNQHTGKTYRKENHAV